MKKLLPFRRWRETEKGQALVEFAFVLPVFILLLFGLVDFGRGFYTWLVVTNAAREGARAAAVQSDWSTTQSKIYASICDSYPSDCALDVGDMTLTPVNIQGPRGSQVTITVDYDFEFVTPIGGIMALIGGSSISSPTISSTSSMRLE
ncbi:MAG: pilus assembly protein [Dehalococcoidia bacterium]|nr:pilus assembly protein [Dehalococcoidia bacterium]